MNDTKMSLALPPHTPSRRHAPPPSPNRSPRSSTSSIPSAPPLTPLFELDVPPDDSALTSSGSSMSDQDESNADDEDEDHTPPGGISGAKSVTASLAAFSFHPTSSSAKPTEGHAEIDQNFSFGTCPSTSAGTPIAERGPFEYPALSSPSTSPRASVFALGETYRRGSIVATSHHSSSFSEHRRPSHPSPPATRRSSTCSTITTLPTGGRRPSILHSATTGLGPAPPPLPLAFTPDSPINNNGLPASFSAARRPSLAFPQKRMETPIPPSLMGRRGSLPAAQLFGLPHTGELSAKLGRASFAGQGQGQGGGYGYGYTTSTPALYARRASMMSDSGISGISSANSSQTTIVPLSSPSGSASASYRTQSVSASSPYRTQSASAGSASSPYRTQSASAGSGSKPRRESSSLTRANIVRLQDQDQDLAQRDLGSLGLDTRRASSPQTHPHSSPRTHNPAEGQGQGQGQKYESGTASPTYRQRLASGSFSSNSARGSLLSGGSLSSSEEGDEEAESPGVDGLKRLEGLRAGGGVGGKGTIEV